MLLKTKKITKGKKKVIRPQYIQGLPVVGALFGIGTLPLTLSPNDGYYLFKEPSGIIRAGIIRAGITEDFYQSNKQHFKIITIWDI